MNVNGKANQHGVALVTAMFVIAIVATLATFMAVGQQVWLRQTQNLADLSQADGITRGAIQLAGLLLLENAKKSSPITDLAGILNKPVPLPVEGGFVTIEIVDAQSRFNLNNLVKDNTPNGVEIDMFKRLLTALDFDPNLSYALVDWIDANSDVQGGAEDLDYLNERVPYRAANQRLESVDELKRIRGFKPEMVDALREVVTVLPEQTVQPINVNTAPPKVLAALTGTSASAMKAVEAARANKPFTDINEFKALLPGSQVSGNIGVVTNFFIVTVTTNVGRIVRKTDALVERRSGKLIVHWQEPARLQIEPSKPDET